MVFKGRFFSSKKSDTSSPDASSNSPRSISSNSPRSDKKKPKSTVAQTLTSTFTSSSTAGAGGGGSGLGGGASSRKTQVKEGTKKKDAVKGKESEILLESRSRSGSKKLTPATVAEVKELPSTLPSPYSSTSAAASVSPILASSLGLNRIKTRSGPLPQESFFGFRGDKGGAAAALGASNLSRPGVGKKKEVASQNRVGFRDGLGLGGSVDHGSSSGSSAQTMEQSPVVLPPSRLQNGESSSEAGIMNANLFHIFCYIILFL